MPPPGVDVASLSRNETWRDSIMDASERYQVEISGRRHADLPWADVWGLIDGEYAKAADWYNAEAEWEIVTAEWSFSQRMMGCAWEAKAPSPAAPRTWIGAALAR
jgi:hypothetical protein